LGQAERHETWRDQISVYISAYGHQIIARNVFSAGWAGAVAWARRL